jgi:hypothetical protein
MGHGARGSTRQGLPQRFTTERLAPAHILGMHPSGALWTIEKDVSRSVEFCKHKTRCEQRAICVGDRYEIAIAFVFKF